MTVQYNSESDFEVERRESGMIIAKYTGSKTEVHIPPSIQNLPVIGIGYRAFYCSGISSVTIPNSVTIIGKWAFAFCSNLTSVIMENSIITIGSMAFFECINLTRIIIPDSVASIEERTFGSCASLANITIPDSVISIGHCAFKGCASLTSVTFEAPVPSSDFSADTFYGDLCAKFYEADQTNGTPGTYTTTPPVWDSSVWTRQKENA